MRSPAGISCVGSWKTTRSIGRECKAGDRLSRPVLTAERLDHPDQAPPRQRGRADRGGPTLRRSEPRRTCSRSKWVAGSACRSMPDESNQVRVSTDPTESSRPTGLNAPVGRFPGDHTCGATPVPIPNTAVKPAGPMIVQSRESRSSPGSSIRSQESPPTPTVGGLSSRAHFIRVRLRFRSPGPSLRK